MRFVCVRELFVLLFLYSTIRARRRTNATSRNRDIDRVISRCTRRLEANVNERSCRSSLTHDEAIVGERCIDFRLLRQIVLQPFDVLDETERLHWNTFDVNRKRRCAEGTYEWRDDRVEVLQIQVFLPTEFAREHIDENLEVFRAFGEVLHQIRDHVIQVSEEENRPPSDFCFLLPAHDTRTWRRTNESVFLSLR